MQACFFMLVHSQSIGHTTFTTFWVYLDLYLHYCLHAFYLYKVWGRLYLHLIKCDHGLQHKMHSLWKKPILLWYIIFVQNVFFCYLILNDLAFLMTNPFIFSSWCDNGSLFLWADKQPAVANDTFTLKRGFSMYATVNAYHVHFMQNLLSHNVGKCQALCI